MRSSRSFCQQLPLPSWCPECGKPVLTGAVQQAPVSSSRSLPSPTDSSSISPPSVTSASEHVCPVAVSSSSVNPSTLVALVVQGVSCNALVDTGSSVSLISAAMYSRLSPSQVCCDPIPPSVKSVTGDHVRTQGTVFSCCECCFIVCQTSIYCQ